MEMRKHAAKQYRDLKLCRDTPRPEVSTSCPTAQRRNTRASTSAHRPEIKGENFSVSAAGEEDYMQRIADDVYFAERELHMSLG
ncbi:MAG: hypothetical protein OXT74_07190 [Candidatus Poribacteria bacterium]|nr:hypothetical protein [Candidatus Poribacteria bacterium]